MKHDIVVTDIGEFKKRLGNFKDAELEAIAARNLKVGLANQRDPQLWAASCNLARVLREEMEAREEVAQLVRRRLHGHCISYTAAATA